MNNAVSARRCALRSEITSPAVAGWALAIPLEEVVTVEPSQAMLDDGRKPHYRHPVRPGQPGRTANGAAIRVPRGPPRQGPTIVRSTRAIAHHPAYNVGFTF